MDIEAKGPVAPADVARTADHDTKMPPPSRWEGLRRVPDKMPKIALLILVVEVRRLGHSLGKHLRFLTETHVARREVHILWVEWSYPKLH